MKMTTWTVIAKTGKADLDWPLKTGGSEADHITAREFVHWLAPDSHIDDDSLRSLLGCKALLLNDARRTPSSALVTDLSFVLLSAAPYTVVQPH